jgi:nitrite reductase (NADH) large subunit
MKTVDTPETTRTPSTPTTPPTSDASDHSKTLVVVGNGMVGHKLVETLVESNALAHWNIVVFGEESRPAYDRVALSTYFTGASESDLCLVEPGFYDQCGLTIRLNDAVAIINRETKTVTSAGGTAVNYDALVLATGSYPFVPPLVGSDRTGCFVYRTIDDLDSIRTYADECSIGAVIGGGLLGLEAANALLNLGLTTHVVEFAERLMPLQVDEGGGAALKRRIEALGVEVHTGMRTSEVVGDPTTENVSGLAFDNHKTLNTDMVVFSAGIRPRDQLARECGLNVHDRGGIVVDQACRTSDPHVYAIGECAVAAGKVWGLVAPGYEMARVVAAQILDENSQRRFEGAELSTKLKLMGVDVASFGDAFGTTPDSLSITLSDPIANTYKRLVVSADGSQLLGGVLVGDASAYSMLTSIVRGDLPTPTDFESLISPARTIAQTPSVLSDSATICSCNNVTKGAICAAIAGGLTDVGQVKKATKAGTSCGGCVSMLTDLFNDEMRRTGVEVSDDLCEHFAYNRQQLFDIVRVQKITSFADLIAGHGRGLGCEVCKPTVASMLASTNNGYILDGEQATLQDTNDHFLANIQKDGTYSVVPRVPGGEITPKQLIAIGQVADEFDLYTKITGGQRIDLFGARVEQLPLIWQRLIDAGMESGHAYGKALRTIKSCVGDSWCRYGVQDSTSMAINLELRYRGLRSPHKLKSAVSGCTRECAEAQSKDFGIIATERGWNLYVAGNGGIKPQHAVLLAEDLDDEMLVRLIDRFLMFYVRTAGRLERTATWLNKLDGGVDYLRSLIIDDSLGLCAELETDMAAHVASYACEWKETLASPERLALFRSYINTDAPDPTIVHIRSRGQIQPSAEESEVLV